MTRAISLVKRYLDTPNFGLLIVELNVIDLILRS